MVKEWNCKRAKNKEYEVSGNIEVERNGKIEQ